MSNKSDNKTPHSHRSGKSYVKEATTRKSPTSSAGGQPVKKPLKK